MCGCRVVWEWWDGNVAFCSLGTSVCPLAVLLSWRQPSFFASRGGRGGGGGTGPAEEETHCSPSIKMHATPLFLSPLAFCDIISLSSLTLHKKKAEGQAKGEFLRGRVRKPQPSGPWSVATRQASLLPPSLPSSFLVVSLIFLLLVYITNANLFVMHTPPVHYTYTCGGGRGL